MKRAALVAGATIALPRLAIAQTFPTIVVGSVVAEDSVPLWYAANAGLFRQAGLTVDVQRIGGGFNSPLGVMSGAWNLANSNLLSVVVAHGRNVPLTIVACSGMYNGTTEYSAVLVRKDSPLQSGAELNGRTFGCAGINDLSSLAMHAWMEKHGGDFKALKVIEVPYSAIRAALEEGRIDVGSTLQPYLSNALTTGAVRIFADTYGAIAPRFASAGWIAMASWAEANTEAVRRWARVMHEAQLYCNSHRAETASLLAERSGAELSAILRGGRETYSSSSGDPREVQPLVDVAARYGLIPRRFDAAEIVSPAVRGLS
jgi:NitT/TauT family transport system substrate-binding protein